MKRNVLAVLGLLAGGCSTAPALPDAALEDGGTDAGPPQCVPTEDPALQGLLAALLPGASGAPLGLRTLAGAEIGPIALPVVEGGVTYTLAPALGLAARPDDGVGRAWVGYLTGAERTLGLAELPLDDLGAFRTPDVDTSAIHGAITADLGVDGDHFVAVVVRNTEDTPDAARDPLVWVVDESAARPGVPFGLSYPRGVSVTSSVAITGGTAGFLGAPTTPMRIALDFSSGPGGGSCTLDLTSCHGFTGWRSPSDYLLRRQGTTGRVFAAFEAGIAFLENTSVPSPGASTIQVTREAGGLGAVAMSAMNPSDGMVVYPSLSMPGTVGLARVDCPEGLWCEASEPRTASIAAVSLALAPLAEGYVMVALHADLGLSLHHVTAAGDVVDLDVDGPIVALPSMNIRERVVEMRVVASAGPGSARGRSGASIVVALLLRNETTFTDRIWLGGLAACAR